MSNNVEQVATPSNEEQQEEQQCRVRNSKRSNNVEQGVTRGEMKSSPQWCQTRNIEQGAAKGIGTLNKKQE